MISEQLRRYGFWVLDYLRGAPIKKHLYDISTHMENDFNGSQTQVQQFRLAELIKYTTANVEFYFQYQSTMSLYDLPITNKTLIKENYDKFQSVEYKNKKSICLQTSGSTGTPFVVKQDINKRNRVYAEMLYFWGKAGYRVGMRYIYFRVWTDMNRRSFISAKARNIIMEDILRFDSEELERIRRKLKADLKIKMIIGYASTLEILAHYLYQCGDTPDMFNISVIISISEMLSEIVRKNLSNVFGCNVVSLYSNQENGMIAQECNGNYEFHINSASYFVELLKFDCDKPVDRGEEGRIVITDLYNHAMPLIRYDTGDVAVWKEKICCSWRSQAFEFIKGRIADFVYDTNGRKISPHTISVLMWKFDKLMQFQFIQLGKFSYQLKLNGAQGYYLDEDFIAVFKNLLGDKASISIEHIHEIPVLESGKRKRVICHYQPGLG